MYQLTVDHFIKAFPHDKPMADSYLKLISKYQITDWETFVRLYDADALLKYLPENPTEKDVVLINTLNGVEGHSVYLDYFRSNNTFELLMCFQEQGGSDLKELIGLQF